MYLGDIKGFIGAEILTNIADNTGFLIIKNLVSTPQNSSTEVAFPVPKIVTLRSLFSKKSFSFDLMCQTHLLSYLHVTAQSLVNGPSFH